jgi:hypothetical protein
MVDKGSTRHCREKLLAVVAAKGQLGAIGQKDRMVAMEQRLYLTNGVLTNYNRATCSNELLRSRLQLND